jgi:cell division protein DivIC
MRIRTQLLIIAVSLFVAIGVIGSIWDLYHRKDIVAVREKKLLELQKENKTLKEKLTEVLSPGFVEREARDKLGMAKPGETVALVGQPGSDESRLPEDFLTPPLPNWKQWWQVFF